MCVTVDPRMHVIGLAGLGRPHIDRSTHVDSFVIMIIYPLYAIASVHSVTM